MHTKNMTAHTVFTLVLLVFPFALSAAPPESSALPDAFKPSSLLWELPLGTHQYTVPLIDQGQMFLGINDTNIKHPAVKRTGGGILMSINPTTGEVDWQLPIPRFVKGNTAPMHFNHWRCGVCSTPAISGKYLYIVGPRGDILCVDRKGQADGNDGPFTSEIDYMEVPRNAEYKLTAADGDIVWAYNMITNLRVVPHDVCGSSPAILGDYVYACTSNGQGHRHRIVVRPKAPSLIVLHKKTGKLVAVDNELIGTRMFHGQWSSPVVATIDGQTMILFGGGDGILYAFEPVKPSSNPDTPLHLKKLWQYDCNPADLRFRDGKPIPYSKWNNKSKDGPSEVISRPVVYNNRIYVSIGQSPVHGPGRGALSCIDGKGKKVWESSKVERTTATAAIDNGLVYMSDIAGRLHCLDADTGKQYWQQELDAGVWCASPAVIDGRVYVSSERKVLWVMKAGKEKQLISRSRTLSNGITLMAHGKIMYYPTQRRLFAIKRTSE